MMKFGRNGWSGLVLLLVGLQGALGADPQTPSFREVYDLIRTNVVGLTESELNRAAVEGLLSQLRGRAVLVTNVPQKAADTGPAIPRSNLFDGAYVYLRIGRMDSTTAAEFDKALEKLKPGKLRGLVLDLRFTDGQDYAAAAQVADRFFFGEQPLLDWGNGLVKSKEKQNALKAPVAVLVNAQTTGAAEALAGILQKTEVALLIGRDTPGAVGVLEDFNLKSGETLRLATGPVKVGRGETISAKGLKADIEVPVPVSEEKAYLEDPYRIVSKPGGPGTSASTNLASSGTNRVRLNEAELVRRMKEGLSPEPEVTAVAAGREDKPVLRDPVLVRALDLLKAVAVVYRGR